VIRRGASGTRGLDDQAKQAIHLGGIDGADR
jgi:hypothetical protein